MAFGANVMRPVTVTMMPFLYWKGCNFFINISFIFNNISRYEYDAEGGYCNFNSAATGSVRLEEMLCYELTPGARYEDSFYSFAVPRCRALDRHYDDAFNDDGTLVDGANAFTVFEVIIRDPLTDRPVKPDQKRLWHKITLEIRMRIRTGIVWFWWKIHCRRKNEIPIQIPFIFIRWSWKYRRVRHAFNLWCSCLSSSSEKIVCCCWRNRIIYSWLQH